jgi:hypoxanthine-DNA glycosylase
MEGRIFSLDPVVDERTRVLVLGSMPGRVSLARGEYYAHPRNRFWPLMEVLTGVPVDAPYHERMKVLNNAGIGLWDVLGSCERMGSLDADIARSTERCNDIASLLDGCKSIRLVCCNGGKAYATYKSAIEPHIQGYVLARIDIKRMSSSSSANASFSLR